MANLNVVPDGWRAVKFKEVFHDYKYGPRFSSKDYDEFGNVKTIRGTDVSSTGEIKYQQVPTAKLDETLVDNNQLYDGDLVMITTADCGMTAVFYEQKIPYIASAYAIRLTPTEFISSEYSKFFMQTSYAKKQVDSFVRKGTVANLPGSDVMNLVIDLPPLPEQQKIAAILTSVDEVIDKTQAQIDKLKDLKTAMMQELLLPSENSGVGTKQDDATLHNSIASRESYIPHTEFKDSPVGRIPKSWEVVKFKDIFLDYKYGPRFSSKDYDTSGNVKTIRGTDLSNNGVIKYRQVPIARLDTKLVEKNALKNGDLVMITTADCGATAVFESQSIPYIASAYAIKLTPRKGLNSKYINYFMQTNNALIQVDSFVRKGTVANLPGSDVMSIILALPSIEEQNKVVLILEQLDMKIMLKQEVLSSKKNIKKALMQDLLTGKVRVKVD
ncbi:restriction endonuclease subunit S [Shewanella sp. SR43-8]|uniref:restriction endonuclease subunit S n=1 Tax=Shewanella sp. SR43-8 TaxID=2760938 RepID=UPI0015FF9EBE|nr:restriction endonuclease subunit S [Shewanella sp. SR43-8]MBB1323551.1 restriction endonuclease subunit S [Shewanella sp. SR43-8]